MAREKICGIYKIENDIDGKVYIGQSVDIISRWNRHKNRLSKGIHENKHLQRAWDLYGSENFIFDIVYLCDINDLDKYECKAISQYNSSNPEYGYNKTDGGIGALNSLGSRKSVILLNTLEVFKSLAEAERQTGINQSSIGFCCMHKYAYAGTINGEHAVWMHLSEFVDSKLTDLQIKNIISDAQINPLNKRVVLLNTKSVYKSITEASNITNVSFNGIALCCKHIQKHGGRDLNGNALVWMYYDEYIELSDEQICALCNDANVQTTAKKVILLNENIVFDSLTLGAAWASKCSNSTISRVCKGKQKYAGVHPITGEPLRWMYYDEYLAQLNIYESEVKLNC